MMILAVAAFLTSQAGCGSTARLARPEQPKVPYAPGQVATSAPFVPIPNKVFVANWQPQQRAELSADIRTPGRLSVVRYDSRGVRLLRECRLPGAYLSIPLPPEGGITVVTDSSEYGAGAPGGLGATAGATSAAALEYVIAGNLRADRSEARTSELLGQECQQATHFIRSLYIGAFQTVSSAGASAGAAAEVAGVGAHGHGSSGRTVLDRGGDLQACRRGTALGEACGAPIAIEVAPIRLSTFAHVSFVGFRIDGKPSGQPWDGNESPPDPRFTLTVPGQPPFSTDAFDDQWSSSLELDLGRFELREGFSVVVAAADADALSQDPIGTATLGSEQLRRAGYVEVPLLQGKAVVGGVRFRVAVSRGH